MVWVRWTTGRRWRFAQQGCVRSRAARDALYCRDEPAIYYREKPQARGLPDKRSADPASTL